MILHTKTTIVSTSMPTKMTKDENNLNYQKIYSQTQSKTTKCICEGIVLFSVAVQQLKHNKILGPETAYGQAGTKSCQQTESLDLVDLKRNQGRDW